MEDHTNISADSAAFTEDGKAFPDFILDVIRRLSDSDLEEKLKSFLVKSRNDFSQCEACCQAAQAELIKSVDRLSSLETELNDIRSAAALMASGQDDALSNLKRRFDEELASLQHISQHQLAESQANSMDLFQKERAQWIKERDALLARLNSQRPTKIESSFSNQRFDAHDISTRISDHPKPNPIKDSKPLSPGGHPSSELNTNLANSVELYENEIARLRGMLEDCMMKHDPGWPEGDPSVQNHTSTATQLSTIVSSVQTSIFEENTPDTSQNVSSEQDMEYPLDDIKTPVSELAWIRLQSDGKKLVRHSSGSCFTCKNYEQQLQTVQLSCELKDKNLKALAQESSDKSAELADALQRIAELETDLKTRSLEQSDSIAQLESTLDKISNRLENVWINYRAHRQYTETELSRLATQQTALQFDFDVLQSHYDALLGRRSTAAAELSEQPIQLPSDKSDLELLSLRLYEENLALRAAREHLDERLQNEAEFHHQQWLVEKQKWSHSESVLQRELDDTNGRLASLVDIVSQRDTEVEARHRAEKEVALLRSRTVDLQSKLEEAESDASRAKLEVANLQQRLVCLQADLDNVESVQADFVRLSQNLQMQLEQLRQQEHEVRWVDPDDVSACFACNSVFPPGSAGTTRKSNCKHCGKVYCPNCLRNTVSSAPIGRLVRVCNVCHTLLNKHAAPYFSTSFIDPSTGTQVRTDSAAVRSHSSIGESVQNSSFTGDRTVSLTNP